MDGTDETGRGQPGGAQASLDLDALAVSDRFRLFNFTRRDDHLAYLWVLRALERLRAVHHVQANPEDIAQALVTELLGFRPTRHTPLGTDATLYVPALGPGPAGPEDDED